jgi:hypothetical protein
MCACVCVWGLVVVVMVSCVDGVCERALQAPATGNTPWPHAPRSLRVRAAAAIPFSQRVGAVGHVEEVALRVLGRHVPGPQGPIRVLEGGPACAVCVWVVRRLGSEEKRDTTIGPWRKEGGGCNVWGRHVHDALALPDRVEPEATVLPNDEATLEPDDVARLLPQVVTEEIVEPVGCVWGAFVGWLVGWLGG